MTAMKTKYARKAMVTMVAGRSRIQKRIAAISLALLVSAVPASGQGTTMPIPLAQWFDNAGTVLTSGGFCVFVAGTSTAATTYTTAALTVPNANPVLFSSGRPSSGGVFLTPGSSYKFELRDFTGVGVPTCGAGVGTTIWTVDNVAAVPTSATSVDITATAGVSIAAGQVVYLSDGSGSLTAGQWYLADADLPYAGALPIVGIAPSAIASGASGSVRISGRVTGLTGLTVGGDHYVSGTAGSLTTTAPGYARFVGQAESATVLIVSSNPRSTATTPTIPCGRLTLTTATPVTSADVTAAATLYYTPYLCSTITLYDGTRWSTRTFTEVSIAAPAAANQMYDVFAFDSAGTLTLELTAWTNDTTRATALVKQNGVWVRTGATTRLYLGSVRTVTASQFNDTMALRHLWNFYNRVPRALRRSETAGTWTYTTATVRQANGSTANQVETVIGVAEVQLDLSLHVTAVNDTAANISVGIGQGSTTTYAEPCGAGGGVFGTISCRLMLYPAIGRQFWSWNEWSTAVGTTTWYSTAGFGGIVYSGLRGWIEG